jgi:hypothetical protein
MKARLPSLAFGVAASLLLSACGGGGGSAPSSGPLPSTGSGGTVGTQPQGSAPATFALSIQQYTPVHTSGKQRRTAFVSPATAQISLKVVSVDGVAQTGSAMTFAVSPSSPNCAGVSGVVTCNLSATVPIGNDVLSASTLDANGVSLGSSTITASVAQNATNRIALAIGGQIANLQLYLSTNHFTPGTPANASVIVVPLDQSGAEIVNPGNYSPAIAVTSSSTAGGHLSLLTDGANTGQSGSLNSPNDQVVVAYDGGGTSGSSTITANAGGGITASKSVNISSPGLGATPSGPQRVSSDGFIFTSPGQTGTITVSGGTPPYTITSSDSSLATITGTTPGPYTIAASGYGLSGSETVTVTDNVNATSTIPVTFIVAPVVLAFGTCGGTTCTSSGATYTIPLSGPAGALSPTTVNASGGTGTFTYFFISSGTTTSPYMTVSQTGSTFTITPSGFGNDAMIVSSGNQSTYYAITASADAFGQTLPRAIGLLIEGSVGKFYSATLPATVTNVTSSHVISGFVFNAGGPSISATPQTTDVSTGVFTFSNGFGTTSVPYTIFGVSFLTYTGTGVASSSEQTTPGAAPGADEQFPNVGLQDTVTVSGYSGTLSATSSNTGIVTASVAGNHVTVSSAGAGTAAITLTDGSGASATYPVSVTTTTIPIAGTTRRP